MVKREELEQMIKEKIVLIGDTGKGKTYTAVKISEFVASHGKDVVYIDPEYGSQRELELLSDEVLERINLKVTPGWLETKKAIESNDGCFLKVLDGLSEVFEQMKYWLQNRFILQGYYVAGDTDKEIRHKETFVLPFTAYPKVYDALRQSVRLLCNKQKPHVICTMHLLGETAARLRLSEDIYRKFDTMIRVRRDVAEVKDTTTGDAINRYVYDALLHKHRGRPITAVARMSDHVKAMKKLFAKRMGVEYVEEETNN